LPDIPEGGCLGCRQQEEHRTPVFLLPGSILLRHVADIRVKVKPQRVLVPLFFLFKV
jgi:hypothetical protein